MSNKLPTVILSTEIYNAWQLNPTKNKEMESNGKEKENWEIQQKMGPKTGQRTVKFHSKAKQGSDEAYLSNFQVIPGGVVIDEVQYISVEHYYQSMKFKPQHRAIFKGLDAELQSPKQAKSAGSKGAMRKMVGYVCYDTRWKAASSSNDEDYCNIRVMKKALWARFQQDKRFQTIVMQPDVYFEHYQKPRGKFKPNRIPDWGCYLDKKNTGTVRGLNILGNLLNELNAFYERLPGYFETDGKLNWSGSTPNVGGLNWFPYPRNTFGVLRDHDLHGKFYDMCGYLVKDSDVVHPFLDVSIIMHA